MGCASSTALDYDYQRAGIQPLPSHKALPAPAATCPAAGMDRLSLESKANPVSHAQKTPVSPKATTTTAVNGSATAGVSSFKSVPSARTTSKYVPLSVEDKRTIRRHWKRLAVVRDESGRLLVDGMLEKRKAIGGLFRDQSPAFLASQMNMMVSWAVDRIDEIDSVEMTETLKTLGSRHVTYKARNADYAIFGEALLATLCKHLPASDTLNPDAESAWRRFFNRITSGMTGDETEALPLKPAGANAVVGTPKSPMSPNSAAAAGGCPVKFASGAANGAGGGGGSGPPTKITDMARVMGIPRIKKLCEVMYEHVWEDHEAPWFRDMFRDSAPREHATNMLVLFCVQQMGGPSLYGGFQHPPESIMRFHDHFPITGDGLERWLFHMKRAMGEVDLGPYPVESKRVLLDWFDEFGSAMINQGKPGQKASKPLRY